MNNPDNEDHLHQSVLASDALVQQLRPLLADKPPEVVAAALAECIALLLAGHHPAMRETAAEQFFQLAVDLIPACIGEMRDSGRYPVEWDEWKPGDGSH